MTSPRAAVPSARCGYDQSTLESLILFVSDLAAAKAFYVGALGLPVLFKVRPIASAASTGQT